MGQRPLNVAMCHALIEIHRSGIAFDEIRNRLGEPCRPCLGFVVELVLRWERSVFVHSAAIIKYAMRRRFPLGTGTGPIFIRLGTWGTSSRQRAMTRFQRAIIQAFPFMFKALANDHSSGWTGPDKHSGGRYAGTRIQRDGERKSGG